MPRKKKPVEPKEEPKPILFTFGRYKGKPVAKATFQYLEWFSANNLGEKYPTEGQEVAKILAVKRAIESEKRTKKAEAFRRGKDPLCRWS